ncbi:hypothetical protein LY90DRAFT_513519 [Neocallimastix californiae]|uniref:LysM domain-containing protein n=1 Tax=Neocallimastix californiae TaxID=1754190 RepID=A0A1Y2AXF7_9FUNG|nr:hypothetical protein LY90DRAFT_513519 [Neocallimastix californiae]|eukprot:ORY27134.1 hypothetical protein LY90DRAFT_513519 [Neocallimastix californiae]
MKIRICNYLIIFFLFPLKIKSKTLGVICEDYYEIKNEKSYREVVISNGITVEEFFKLNPNFDCTNVKGIFVCIKGTASANITVNEKQNLNLSVIAIKLSFKHFDNLLDSLNDKENFKYNDCVELCRNGQNYYEKLVNDKSNICNYNVIEELNVFDGVYDSNIKTPYNLCKLISTQELKLIEEIENNQETQNNSEIKIDNEVKNKNKS